MYPLYQILSYKLNTLAEFRCIVHSHEHPSRPQSDTISTSHANSCSGDDVAEVGVCDIDVFVTVEEHVKVDYDQEITDTASFGLQLHE